MTSEPWGGARTYVTARVVAYPPGTIFGPRQLDDFYQLVWILTGSAQWSLDRGPAIEVKPGRLLLAKPHQTDHFVWSQRQPCSHAFVHFTLDPGVADDWPSSVDFQTVPAVGALCDYLLDLPDPEPDDRHHDRVLGLLMEMYHRGISLQTKPLGSPLLERMLGKVRLIWQEEGLRIISARELANAAGISTGHMFRLFREEFDRGPAEILEVLRLSVATSTLRRSNASIADVADLCGFANPFHFSKRFKAVVGTAPTAYRELERVDPREIVRQARLTEVARQVLDPRATLPSAFPGVDEFDFLEEAPHRPGLRPHR